MNTYYRLYVISFFVILVSCKESTNQSQEAVPELVRANSVLKDSMDAAAKAFQEQLKREQQQQEQLARYQQNRKALDTLPPATFVDLETLSDTFMYALKYATADNFLKKSVYDCAKCYVRVPVAKALLAANKELMKKGYTLKFFDCYRPYSVQKKMWKIFPNPYYLASPKKGSIHNKGGAVDITLATLEGVELDMGTGFDHFGEEAHHAYTDFADEVLENRKLLRETMKKHGFWTIRTEWWHYNYQGASRNAIADFTWACDE